MKIDIKFKIKDKVFTIHNNKVHVFTVDRIKADVMSNVSDPLITLMEREIGSSASYIEHAGYKCFKTKQELLNSL